MKKMPNIIWGEVVLTTALVENRYRTKQLNKIPEEV